MVRFLLCFDKVTHSSPTKVRKEPHSGSEFTVFVSPLHPHPMIIKVHAQQLRACIKLAVRERQTGRKRERDDVLLIPPVAAEQ